MPDIIDEIDRLHEKATPYTWGKSCAGVCGSWGTVFQVTPQFTYRGSMRGVDADLIVALVNHWPALSSRLREAERKERAFLHIQQGTVEWEYDPGRNEFAARVPSGRNHWATELLTAIESALAAKADHAT